MRVIIAGSRNINDYNLVLAAIKHSGFEISEVVSGGCLGVDQLGERWAKENNIPIKRFKADWEKYGKSAGPKRNLQMAKGADALIVVKTAFSRGSLNMMGTATSMGLKVYKHPIIVGLVGVKQSGKTTASKYLNKFGYQRYSFAEPVKKIAQTMFLFSDDQIYHQDLKEVVDPRWGFSPRHAMQQIGTEIGRNFDTQVWIKNMHERIQGASCVTIDDVRFQNEADYIRDMGGLLIGLSRGLFDSNDPHESEAQMKRNWKHMTDVTIPNQPNKEHLYEQIKKHIIRPNENSER